MNHGSNPESRTDLEIRVVALKLAVRVLKGMDPSFYADALGLESVLEPPHVPGRYLNKDVERLKREIDRLCDRILREATEGANVGEASTKPSHHAKTNHPAEIIRAEVRELVLQARLDPDATIMAAIPGLQPRTVTALTRHGRIEMVGDLVGVADRDLCKIRGFGEGAMFDLKKNLNSLISGINKRL